MLAVLDDVATAPPPRFSGGGYWEAIHGAMTSYFEVRKQGPKREQFRLFCLLDKPTNDTESARTGFPGPMIVVLTGMRKAWRTAFSDADYAHVRELGEAYLETFPRRIAK